MKDKILLIGGSNIDYIAKSDKRLIREDSNPGTVSVSFGGVGRNIVENLARLNDQVTFITGIGNDRLGKQLVEDLESLSVKVIYPVSDTASSSYVAICSNDGDMDTAVCDSRAIDNLSINFIRQFDDEIRAMDYLIMDCNLSLKTIGDLFHVYPDKKWCVEAVSVNKVTRVGRFLHKIYLLKGNAYEIRALAGVKEDVNLSEAIKKLLEKGVQNIVATQGAKPVLFGSGEGIIEIPVKPLKKEEIVNATGAGDAMFAGIIHMMNQGATWKECVEFGEEMSALALKSERAVSWEISKLSDWNPR